jgi:hypothetical protein
MQILKFAKHLENMTVLTNILFNMNKGLALKLCLSLFFYVESLCFLGCDALSLSEYEGAMILPNTFKYPKTQLHISEDLNFLKPGGNFTYYQV